jgi:hypothetical protein
MLAACMLTGGCTLLEQHDLRIEPSGPIALDDNSPLARADAPVFRVAIRTTPDLRAYGTRTGFNIAAAMSVCANGAFDPARPLQADVYVYDAHGAVGYADAPPSASPDYFLYARVRAVPLAGQNITWYDLAQMPQDVCVILRGGETLGATFRSNTLVIPAAAITDALRPTP